MNVARTGHPWAHNIMNCTLATFKYSYEAGRVIVRMYVINVSLSLAYQYLILSKLGHQARREPLYNNPAPVSCPCIGDVLECKHTLLPNIVVHAPRLSPV